MDGVLDQPAGEPIIDVHLHAYPLDAALGPTLTNPATGAPGSVVDGSRCSLLSSTRRGPGAGAGAPWSAAAIAQRWRLIAAAGRRVTHDDASFDGQ
jgi:hypothetical protein